MSLSVVYAELERAAGLVDTTADGLRDAGGAIAPISYDGNLLEAAVLCPAEVAAVEAAVARSTIGPSGATWLGVELEVLAGLVRTAVTVYREVDERLRALADVAVDGAEALRDEVLREIDEGIAEIQGLIGAGQDVYDFLTDDPIGDTIDAASWWLYDNPWVMDAASRALPVGLQTLAFSGASLAGPFGPPLLSWATGGHWPTGDYNEAVIGLQTLMGRFGTMQDTGPIPVGEPSPRAPQLIGDEPVTRLLQMEDEFAYGSSGDGASTPQIAVTPVTGHDGSTRFIVNIPGTEEWGLERGSNPFDLTTNVQLLGHEESRAQQAVLRAMEGAGVPDGAEVMLVGHSQGGILAASIAQDPSQPYTVRSVLTAGSPIARFDIPPDVSVLSLEHTQDAVPLAEGAHNPQTSMHQTIRRPMDPALVEADNPIAAAHATRNYAATATELHASGDLTDFEERNRDFFVTSEQRDGESVTGDLVQVPVGRAEGR